MFKTLRIPAPAVLAVWAFLAAVGSAAAIIAAPSAAQAEISAASATPPDEESGITKKVRKKIKRIAHRAARQDYAARIAELRNKIAQNRMSLAAAQKQLAALPVKSVDQWRGGKGAPGPTLRETNVLYASEWFEADKVIPTTAIVTGVAWYVEFGAYKPASIQMYVQLNQTDKVRYFNLGAEHRGWFRPSDRTIPAREGRARLWYRVNYDSTLSRGSTPVLPLSKTTSGEVRVTEQYVRVSYIY